MSYDYVFKYIIVGDMAVGKSSVLLSFCEHRFLDECPHTIGVEFGTRVIESVFGKRIKLEIWDTAGQERFRSVTRSYYRSSAAALLVYDVSKRATFQHISSWLTDALHLTSQETVLILLGNKSDLNEEREVSFEEASAFAEENRLLFLETSAKTGENINAVFMKTARTILERVQEGKISVDNSGESGVRSGQQTTASGNSMTSAVSIGVSRSGTSVTPVTESLNESGKTMSKSDCVRCGGSRG